MPDLKTEDVDVPDGIPIRLRRMENEGAPPVLLLHGASAQSGTFLIPAGNSLADYLWRHGYEPWLLDWRGSCVVTKKMQSEGDLQAKRRLLDLDLAASQDLRLAIERIQVDHPSDRVHIIAHCLGAAVVAQAIASDTIPLERVGRVVLLTLGLFYEPAMDGRLKSQVRVLDRLWRAGEVSIIDPCKPREPAVWPKEVERVYEQLGTSVRPHPEGDVDPDSPHALCNRVSLMYGVPYHHPQLVPEIHGDRRVLFVEGEVKPSLGERLRTFRPKKELSSDSQFPIPRRGEGVVSDVTLKTNSWTSGRATGEIALSCATGNFTEGLELWTEDANKVAICGRETSRGHDAELGEQFGGIPLRMYLQGIYNVRRKWAAPFPSSSTRSFKALEDRSLIGKAARKNFRRLESLLLVTGARNQLWHRDSVDRMYQWLLQEPAREPGQFKKHVFKDYGHQDLLWGKESSAEGKVFDYLVKHGLGGRGARLAFEEGETDDSEVLHSSS